MSVAASDPAFDGVQFKEVMSRFATGVTVITAIDDTGPIGFTCQSFISLSLSPPLVALAPAKTSTSWPRIARAGSFGVNVLSDAQEDICQRFAVSGADKFAGVQWAGGEVTGAPILSDVIAWVECSLELIHDAGDHEFVIGRALHLGVTGGSPLIFYRGSFSPLADATAQ